MTERADKFAQGKRLVLGFDAGCRTCTDLARSIEQVVGDKLEIRSLHDPQVEDWRKEALGEEAPWEPTLIEIKDGEVKALTGIRMGAYLSRSLGPVATWQIMQVLGEVGAAQQENNSVASRALAGMSRMQFLKGVGGAVVAMSLISGVGSFASPASAKEKAASKTTKFKEFRGGRLVKAVRKAAERQDVINVAPGDLTSLVQSQGEDAKAGIHELDNGNKMLAVAVALSSDRVLVYYETREAPVRRGPVDKSVERPVKRGAVNKSIQTEAKVIKIEGESGRLEKSSHNELLDSLLPQTDGDFSSQAGIPGGGGCGGCSGIPGDRSDYELCYTCLDYNLICLGISCAGCFSCYTGNVPACLFCAFVTCPYGVAQCCNYRGYRCCGCGSTL